MDDTTIEREIQAKGLTAPRVTKDEIDALMARVTYRGGRIDTTTSTVVHAFLDDSFLLASGHSACVSPENFNEKLGFDMAASQAAAKAREQLWLLEGYALRKQLASVPADFRDRVRQERDALKLNLEKLDAFAGTPAFYALPIQQRLPMLDQQEAMTDYLAALERRIAAFDR